MEEFLPKKTPGDYYVGIREFKNDSIEVIVKTLSPMYGGAVINSADPLSYSNYCKEKKLPTGLGRSRSCEDKPMSEYRKEENHKRAVRQSKKCVRFLVKQIEADRLLTLSTRENIQDRERFKKCMKEFFRLVRKGWGGQQGIKNFAYVAVLEKQERGAYHAHIAIKGAINFNFLRTAWHKALGCPGMMTGESSPGNVDVTSPRKARWGTEFSRWPTDKLSGYITKYMSKTFDDDLAEKHRYFKSRDIEKPLEKKYMLNAKTMLEALQETIEILGLLYDYEFTFENSYNAPTGDTIWFSLGGKK